MLHPRQLFDHGVVSQSTLEWLLPHWEKEQKDLDEIRESRYGNNLFNDGSNDDDDGNDDNDDEGDDDGAASDCKQTVRNLGYCGVSISYARDERSAGHGDRVWHASIATCLYLERLLVDESLMGDANDQLRYLELGAGTALPSLFAARILVQIIRRRTLHENKFGEEGNYAPPAPGPLVHVTDAKRYRNIRQILKSVHYQPDWVREHVRFRVSPHDWGEVVGGGRGGGIDDCDKATTTEFSSSSCGYDLMVMSDCIYNPDYHDALLDSLAAFLKLPPSAAASAAAVASARSTTVNSGSSTTAAQSERAERLSSANNDAAVDDVQSDGDCGGLAICAFSLHGNADEERIWEFIENKVPAKRHAKHPNWRLQARSIIRQRSPPPPAFGSKTKVEEEDEDEDTCNNNNINNNEGIGRPISVRPEAIVQHEGRTGGWNMEETMKRLDLWSANMDPRRWIVYLYEISWHSSDEGSL